MSGFRKSSSLPSRLNPNNPLAPSSTANTSPALSSTTSTLSSADGISIAQQHKSIFGSKNTPGSFFKSITNTIFNHPAHSRHPINDTVTDHYIDNLIKRKTKSDNPEETDSNETKINFEPYFAKRDNLTNKSFLTKLPFGTKQSPFHALKHLIDEPQEEDRSLKKCPKTFELPYSPESPIIDKLQNIFETQERVRKAQQLLHEAADFEAKASGTDYNTTYSKWLSEEIDTLIRQWDHILFRDYMNTLEETINESKNKTPNYNL